MRVFYFEMSRQCPIERTRKKPASLQALSLLVGRARFELATNGLKGTVTKLTVYI